MYYELTRLHNKININYDRYCYLIVMPGEIYSAKPVGDIIDNGMGNGSSRWVTLNDINYCLKSKETITNNNNNVWIVHPENLRNFLTTIVLDDYIHQKDLALQKFHLARVRKTIDDFDAEVHKARSLLRKNILTRKKCEILSCNIDLSESLIASHIWSVEEIKKSNILSNDLKIKNIMDENNAFLLCPIHDKLFDRYFITFDKHGIIKCSQKIRNSIKYYGFDPDKLNIPVIKINDKNLPFLSKHNSIFEKKWKE